MVHILSLVFTRLYGEGYSDCQTGIVFPAVVAFARLPYPPYGQPYSDCHAGEFFSRLSCQRPSLAALTPLTGGPTQTVILPKKNVRDCASVGYTGGRNPQGAAIAVRLCLVWVCENPPETPNRHIDERGMRYTSVSGSAPCGSLPFQHGHH